MDASSLGVETIVLVERLGALNVIANRTVDRCWELGRPCQFRHTIV